MVPATTSGRSRSEPRFGLMETDVALQYVHALSVPTADNPLRERQILMLQQTSHNARVTPRSNVSRSSKAVLGARSLHCASFIKANYDLSAPTCSV